MQVRDALMRTTIQRKDGTSETAVYPNNYYGYGFVDAYDAALSLGPVFSNEPLIVKMTNGYTVTTMLVSKYPLYPDSIFYYYRFDDTSVYSRALLVSTSNPNEYSAVVPLSLNDSLPRGYFSAREQKPLSVPPHENVPVQFSLFQNYPNPFNGETTIRFDSPRDEEGEVAVFNILGQRVKTIFQGRTQIGITTLHWNGVTEVGTQATTGVYFVRLKTPTTIVSKKMLYLK